MFTLSDLNGATDLIALYDSYRIRSVEVNFVVCGVQQVTSPYAPTAIVAVPMMTTVIDYNDISVPSSLAELDRYSTVVTQPSTISFVRKFSPRWQAMVYNGLVSTAYALGSRSAWLSTATSAIPHFGLKYCLGPDSGSGLSQRFQYTVRVRYTVQFSHKK